VSRQFVRTVALTCIWS